eukprot:1803709-Pleurochrysis_carterae.AAC.1
MTRRVLIKICGTRARTRAQAARLYEGRAEEFWGDLMEGEKGSSIRMEKRAAFSRKSRKRG